MIDQSEPLERLRAANPVPVPNLSSATSPAALDLFRRIVAEEAAGPGAPPAGPARPARPSRRRARRLVPAVLLTVVAGAVAYAVGGGDVSKPHNVACYQRADLSARTEVVRVDARGPAAACADLWARGVFGDSTVPALAECALPSGSAGVFPSSRGADECRRLGLTALPSATTVPALPPPAPGSSVAAPPADVNAAFLAFRDAVLPQFLDAHCVDPAAAQDIVRRELDRAGLGDWTIRDGQGVGDGFSAERPCATLGFRPDEHQILLVPAPPRR